MSSTSWTCQIDLDVYARPGILADIVNVFAERGISLDQVLATDQGGKPMIIVSFTVTEQMCRFLSRRLARIPRVTDITTAKTTGRVWWDSSSLENQQHIG